MPSFRYLTLSQLFLAVTQAQPMSQPPIWSAKPDVTAFEKLENDRLAGAQQSIDRVVAVKGGHTIENTVAPFDQAKRQLDAAQYLAYLMERVHPETAFRDSATTMSRRVGEAISALTLNHAVYAALAALDLSRTDPATRYYVGRQLLLFRLAGVNEDNTTRARLRELDDRATNELSMFHRNIADDTKAVEADPSELDGLPQDYIERHKPGTDHKIRITTDYPDFFPVMKFAASEPLRRRLWLAFGTRAYPKNLDVLKEILHTRYDSASLLGYPSWADYNAADKMIAKGAHIATFIEDVDAAARPVADREFDLLLAEYRKTHPDAKEIPDYDEGYVMEMFRRVHYDFDSQQVRLYLPYAQVKRGILDTATKLFHVNFRQELNVPSWAPSVETWDMLDKGRMIGRFYLDMHPRPGKFSNAAMIPVLDGIRGEQLPEAALVCNFPEPTAADPALMDYYDAVSFFHEFGHLTHWILGRQQWAGISGLTMESDFLEAPSQMLEEFMRSPEVLAGFARHYKTGEPMPASLVASMNRASAFGRATRVRRQNAWSAISYDMYRQKPQDVDLDTVVRANIQRYTSFTLTPDSHLWGSFHQLGTYSSAYYTYLWDQVIAEDFFGQFDQINPIHGGVPMRYRHAVLEPGGSVSANDLVKNFLGRRQNMKALKRWMSEEFAR